MTGGARRIVFSAHDTSFPTFLSPPELNGCRKCRSLSRFNAVVAETALQAARTYSQAAACSEPEDAAVLLDAASGELEDAEMYFSLAAYVVRACHMMAAARNGKERD